MPYRRLTTSKPFFVFPFPGFAAWRLAIGDRVPCYAGSTHPRLSICGAAWPSQVPAPPLAFRPGLRPRRSVPDCPSLPVTFRPRSTHNAGRSELVFRGSIPRLSARCLRFHASIALHGQGSLPAAWTCFAARVQASALPQGRYEWFLFRFRFLSPIHRLILSRE